MKLRGVNRMSNEVGARAARRGRGGTGDAQRASCGMPEKPDDGPELDAAVALARGLRRRARPRASGSRSSCSPPATTSRRWSTGAPAASTPAGGPRSPATSSTACSTARPSSASPTAAATSASRTDRPSVTNAHDAALRQRRRSRRGGQHAAVRSVGEHRERRHARQDRGEARPRADREGREARSRPSRSRRTSRPSRSRTTNRPTPIEQNEFFDQSDQPVRPRVESRSGFSGTRRRHVHVVGAGLPATRSLSHATTSSCAATITCRGSRRRTRGSRRCRRPRTPWRRTRR